MKKISKLKLNHLSKHELEQRSLNTIRGGESCSCGCACGCDCSCKSGYETNDIASQESKPNGYEALRYDSGYTVLRDSDGVDAY